jgi:hypothetical protein
MAHNATSHKKSATAVAEGRRRWGEIQQPVNDGRDLILLAFDASVEARTLIALSLEKRPF